MITGVDGFIGQNLANYLSAMGNDIYGVDKKRKINKELEDKLVRYFELDLAKTDLKEDVFKNIEIVVHLAGNAGTNTNNQELKKNNILATENIIKLVNKNKLNKFIFVSSIKALDIENKYGESKKISEEMIEQKIDKEIPYTILRPSVVYGIGMKSNLLNWFRLIKTGIFPRFPESEFCISMVGVNDLCELIHKCIGSTKTDYKIYQICDGNRYNISEIENKVRKYFGIKITYRVPKALLYMAALTGSIFNKCGIKAPITKKKYMELFTCNDPIQNNIDKTLNVVFKQNFYEELPGILEAINNE